jgi:tRNA C32,U32 (ribose-2'-O)-methylase TrmJ
MTIRFILVEPKVPENVGASVRAINTMGFNNLAYK